MRALTDRPDAVPPTPAGQRPPLLTAGLTAALELARRGVAVRVLDAAPAPFPGSRGKGLQPRSLELLDVAGVTDRLVSLGRTTLPIRRHRRDGAFDDVARGDQPATSDTPWPSTL